ncbi:hypothetical protein ABZ092_00465 [Streptomyces bobili]|uniref:hypothetical protein n=1 Tax=Streptomyces bobili TaxID=67280 RepID=UPI0033ABAC8D
MWKVTANGQPAPAAYVRGPGGGHRLHILQVFTIMEGLVTHNRRLSTQAAHSSPRQ